MTKQNIINFFQPKTNVIHITTKHDYDVLMSFLESHNFTWANGQSPTALNVWNVHYENTTISMLNSCLLYANKTYLNTNKCTIVPFETFANIFILTFKQDKLKHLKTKLINLQKEISILEKELESSK